MVFFILWHTHVTCQSRMCMTKQINITISPAKQIDLRTAPNRCAPFDVCASTENAASHRIHCKADKRWRRRILISAYASMYGVNCQICRHNLRSRILRFRLRNAKTVNWQMRRKRLPYKLIANVKRIYAANRKLRWTNSYLPRQHSHFGKQTAPVGDRQTPATNIIRKLFWI